MKTFGVFFICTFIYGIIKASLKQAGIGVGMLEEILISGACLAPFWIYRRTRNKRAEQEDEMKRDAERRAQKNIIPPEGAEADRAAESEQNTMLGERARMNRK